MKNYIFEAIEQGEQYPVKAFVASIEHSSFHWHYDYELILVLKGSLSVNAGPKPVILEAGELLLLNSKAVHELQRTTEDNLCLFIQLNQCLFHDYKEANKTYYFYLCSKEEELQPKKNLNYFVETAAKIGLITQNKDMISFYRMKALIYQLIADLFEYVPYEIHQRASTSKESENAVLLMKIIEFIQENYKRENVLEELYKQLGIGEKTTYRFLKYNIGLSSKELVTACRIDASKPLLKYSEKPIQIIAEECGFGSENTFYRVFRKEVGVTPNEYRHNGAAPESNPEIKGYLSFSQGEALALLTQYSR